MEILFVMDPAETMLPDKDTSFAFIRAAGAMGHHCFHCLVHQVYNEANCVQALARPIAVSDTSPFVSLGEATELVLEKLSAVFIRKDPPFDTAYAHLTRQLDLVKDKTLIVNDPQGLRDANEKLFAFHFAHLMPRSLVTSEQRRIIEFLDRVGGRAVLKPLDGAGGSGVVALSHGDPNTRALVDLLTEEGRRLALVQEFLPSVRQGDKRVLLLDGSPLGAIRRIPRADDIRANIHVGGVVQPTEISAAEQAIVLEVGAELSRRGLWFVGLDLIGEKLIEINVTSPTGIQELGRHQGRSPEEAVIEWTARRVAAMGG